MSCRSSIILEIKECFRPDFAFPLHMCHFLSKSEGFSQSPPQLQLPLPRRVAGSLCWRHLQGRSPPLEQTSHQNKQDTSLRRPFKSLQSEKVTSKATFPTEQSLLCCSTSKGLAQSWIRVLAIQCPTPAIWKCGGCSAWRQLCKKWGTAARVFHKTIWRKSTKNRSEQASCISAKLSIKKSVSMQCLICHRNCFK